jgi:hypothetical protein
MPVRTIFEKDDLKSRKIFLGVFYFCAFVMASITFYAIYVSLGEYMQTGKVVIGQVLVETEFPFKGLAKLITYLMIVSVVGWYCVALYEFVYNFIVWNSLMTADAIRGVMRFDNLNVGYPNPKIPWNLLFATKMSLAAFLISAHGFYTMSKPEKKTD